MAPQWKFIKMMCTYVAAIFHTINMALLEGQLPDSMSEAAIAVLPKKYKIPLNPE